MSPELSMRPYVWSSGNFPAVSRPRDASVPPRTVAALQRWTAADLDALARSIEGMGHTEREIARLLRTAPVVAAGGGNAASARPETSGDAPSSLRRRDATTVTVDTTGGPAPADELRRHLLGGPPDLSVALIAVGLLLITCAVALAGL